MKKHDTEIANNFQQLNRNKKGRNPLKSMAMNNLVPFQRNLGLDRIPRSSAQERGMTLSLREEIESWKPTERGNNIERYRLLLRNWV